jgi:mannitol/fructose-specific phosphotransferase system IIA component (Ntr-type)
VEAIVKSLLNALREGRLIELPDAGKEEALTHLARMIEAVPNPAGNFALAREMIERERAHNTGLGAGVACPHARAAGGGELLCAVGWTPVGIDYGAADGHKVHLLVMYYIPEEQKNAYLKEISSLARATVRAIGRADGIQPISAAEDIATVRARLLDWIQGSGDVDVPGTKVRMIRLPPRVS